MAENRDSSRRRANGAAAEARNAGDGRVGQGRSGDGRAGGGRAGGGRAILALLLAIVAGIAVPVAIAASWTRTLINDTDTFMHTYAPVLETEEMQRVITDQLTAAIVAHLGVADDGIASSAVSRTVEQAVTTDAAHTAKETSLRLIHRELRSELLGESGSLDVRDGRVELRFEPFASALQQRLSDAGVPFVDRLPQISGGVTLITVDPETVPRMQQGVRGLERAATALPWMAGVLVLAALVVAPRRSWALTTFGLSVALSVLAVGFGWDFGVEYGVSRLDGALAEVAQTVAELTSDPIAGPLEAVAIAGVAVSIAAAVAGKRWRF